MLSHKEVVEYSSMIESHIVIKFNYNQAYFGKSWDINV